MQPVARPVQIDENCVVAQKSGKGPILLAQLRCIICHKIPMSEYVEYSYCGKILCQFHIDQASQEIKKCPNSECNISFKKRQKPHPIYEETFKIIRFNCPICKVSREQTPDQKKEQEKSVMHQSETESQPDQQFEQNQLFEQNKKLEAGPDIRFRMDFESQQESESDVCYNNSTNFRKTASYKMAQKTLKPKVAPQPPTLKTPKMPKTKKVYHHEPKVKHEPPVVVHPVYSRQDLCNHLLNDHKVPIHGYRMAYDFEAVLNQGQESIQLTKCQNLVLNQSMSYYQKSKGQAKGICELNLTFFIKLIINWKDDTVYKYDKEKLVAKGQMLKLPSTSLRKNVDYEVWMFDLDEVWLFYTKEQQKIISQNYQKYTQNNNLNECMLDIDDRRYRISFNKKRQINTFTGYQRKIEPRKFRLT